MSKINKFVFLLGIVFILGALYVNAADTSSVIFSNGKLKLTILKTEPSPVQAGGILEMYLRAESVHDDAMVNNLDELKIELVNEFPFSSYGEVSKDLGTLKEGNIIDFRYTVKVDPNAVEGDNNLRFQYAVRNSGYLMSPFITLKVSPTDTSLAVSEITTEPERIEQGSPFQLSIKITNSADSVMKDIKVKMELSGVPLTTLNSVNEKKIGVLGKGDSQDVVFEIIANADADSKAYNIPLNLTYYDESGNKINKNYVFGLLIGGEPDYLLNVEESTGLVKGSSGKAVVSLSNTGVGVIKFAVVTLLDNKKEYDVISNDKIYLGNLKSDDYETAEFNIYPKKSGKINLKVLLEYKDAFNNDVSDVENLMLTVYSSGEASKYGLVKSSGGLGTFLFYVIVVALLWTGYRNWRKCRSVDKACRTTLKDAALFLKKVVRSISLRKFVLLIRKIIRFFREP